MRTRFTYIENIEFSMSIEDAKSCSHSGRCDDNVDIAKQKPYIRKQLNKIKGKDMLNALKAWDCYDDGMTRETMESYIVWIAAGNIVDDEYERSRKAS